ncbi:MAG: DUF2520 domain-containing protein [Legionellaceae bacterium]|nr:DUF2520 domain-containing protein [Legionellaceae bacterium]
MQFNLIGPGRVGYALAHALINTANDTLLGVFHPELVSAKKATQKLGQGDAFNHLKDLPKADITFIATKDEHIEPTALALARAQRFKPKHLIIHMSGILSIDVLTPLKEQGASVGGLHPLKAFCQKAPPKENVFKGVDCAIEGCPLALEKLTHIAHTLDATVFTLNPEKKATYHTAAIMASNYLVTLSSVATTLFEQAGIPATEAHALCTRLMQTSLNNLQQTGAANKALTGPLMRGDFSTIQKHLKSIDSKTIKTLYQTAGLATLPLVNLDTTSIQLIKQLFKT